MPEGPGPQADQAVVAQDERVQVLRPPLEVRRVHRAEVVVADVEVVELRAGGERVAREGGQAVAGDAQGPQGRAQAGEHLPVGEQWN